MRIICGYANDGLRPETRESLEKFAPGVELLDFSGDDFAYWNAIKERWTGEEDLVTIEQDMVITEDTIPSFEKCDRLWCSFGYETVPYAGRVNACLGCTKFSAELQRQFPIGVFNKDLYWCEIDINIGRHLYLHGNSLTPHDHGDVQHLHEYGAGCLKLREDDYDPDGRIYTDDKFQTFAPPSFADLGDFIIYGSPMEKYFLPPDLDRKVFDG